MRILVADDSPVIRAAVTELLSSNGYEVVQASDGIEAVQRFYEDLPDLVLLDLQMPGLSAVRGLPNDQGRLVGRSHSSDHPDGPPIRRGPLLGA